MLLKDQEEGKRIRRVSDYDSDTRIAEADCKAFTDERIIC